MCRSMTMIDWLLRTMGRIASKISVWTWSKQVHRRYYKNKKKWNGS